MSGGVFGIGVMGGGVMGGGVLGDGGSGVGGFGAFFRMVERAAASLWRSRGRAAALACCCGALGALAPDQARADSVAVIIERVRELGCAEVRRVGGVCRGTPDYYAEVSINGRDFERPEVREGSNIAPNWRFELDVTDFDTVVPVEIVIRESDAGVGLGGDDTANINPEPGRTNLRFVIDRANCVTAGDVVVGCNERIETVGDGGRMRTQVIIRLETERPSSSAAPPPPPAGAVGAGSASPFLVTCLQDDFAPPIGELVDYAVEAQARSNAKPPVRLPVDRLDIELQFRGETLRRRCDDVDSCRLQTILTDVEPGERVAFQCRLSSDTMTVSSGWRVAQIGLAPGDPGPIPVRLAADDLAGAVDVVFIPDSRYGEGGDGEAPALFELFAADARYQILSNLHLRQRFLLNDDKLNFWLALDSGVKTERRGDCGGFLNDPEGDMIGGRYAFADVTVTVHPTILRDSACIAASHFSVKSGWAILEGRNWQAATRVAASLEVDDVYACNAACEAAGCARFRYTRASGLCELTNSLAPGEFPEDEAYDVGTRSRSRGVFLHEFGHAPVGLYDEYCCDGGYRQTTVAPNVFTSEEECLADGLPVSAGGCAQISDFGSGETVEFWRLDSETNDLMRNNSESRAADDRRIDALFGRCAADEC